MRQKFTDHWAEGPLGASARAVQALRWQSAPVGRLYVETGMRTVVFHRSDAAADAAAEVAL